MIVPIVGNVSYSITLDPTVWIFDDRKILLDEVFINQLEDKKRSEDKGKILAERFNREVYQSNGKTPPVNKGLTKKEGEEILKNSYVMPFHYFIKNAELKDNAEDATFISKDEKDLITISLEDLSNGYLLFAIDGKPLKADGPVHFFYGDGSNKDNPIKYIKKIRINQCR